MQFKPGDAEGEVACSTLSQQKVVLDPIDSSFKKDRWCEKKKNDDPVKRRFATWLERRRREKTVRFIPNVLFTVRLRRLLSSLNQS